MRRWVSAPNADNPRLSNGWYPRMVWPHVVYGNQVDLVLDLRALVPVAVTSLPLDVQERMRAARRMPPVRCNVADYTWRAVESGANEQVFMVGTHRTINRVGSMVVEMPTLDAQAYYDEAAETWTLVGYAMGNHGTPDYRDGELHVVQIPAEYPRTQVADHITPFAYPIRLPDQINADVWTFGDVVTGTIGGGECLDRPNRQGIGLWPDGRPWLDLSKPVHSIWISPWDAQQGLKQYRDEDHFRQMVAAYRCDHIVADLVADYRAQRARGAWNSDGIEERIAIEVARTTGCCIVVYDDHGIEVDITGEGTRYRPGLLGRAYGLRAMGLGVVLSVSGYQGPAVWAVEDSLRAIIHGDAGWLGMGPSVPPLPCILNLGLYTQAGTWKPTDAARRLEDMVRIGESVGVIGYDVFGVGRGGESAEWHAWADRWLHALLDRTTHAALPWPTTPKRKPPPPPNPAPMPEPPSVPVPAPDPADNVRQRLPGWIRPPRWLWRWLLGR